MNSIAAETERGPEERIPMTRRNKSYQRGTVRQKNGVWTLRYRERNRATGKWKTQRVRLGEFKNQSAALRAAEPIMAQANERNNSTKPVRSLKRFTLQQFVDTRFKTYSAKHEITTVNTRESLLKVHILPSLGEMYLDEVTPGDISDCMGAAKDDLGPGSQCTLYGLLHLLFQLAMEYDLIAVSPVRPKIHRPEGEKSEKVTLTPEQIRVIADNLNPQERLYILLLSVTGLRMSEGLALRWVNVTDTHLLITHSIFRRKLKNLKTKYSKGAIPLHPVMIAMLREHQGDAAPTDFVFSKPDGSPLSSSSVRYRLYRAMDKAGIQREPHKHGFHVFRHSAGSLLYDRLRDLKQVQMVLRHSKVATTADIYVHPGDKVGIQASDALTFAVFGENMDKIASQTSEMVN